MTELSYDALLDRLFPRLTGGIRWGLDRTRRMLAAVDDPQLDHPTIHIGGTNGKGSVAAILESVLRRAGHRTGLYTSPHLVDFRERIRIDGDPIAGAELLAAARALWPVIEAEAPSFFEAATVIGFLALSRARVDLSVIEVGMGGRLDSTNVVDPEVVVITNVTREHARYLGDTIEEIAREKAGIIKPGVPVVTGETDADVLAVLRRRAAEVDAPFHRVAPAGVADVGRAGSTVRLDTGAGPLALRLPLAGRHQTVNLAVAVRALELLPDGLRPDRDAVVEGVARTEWPGRLQVVAFEDGTWIFDVAHNAAGVASLLDGLDELRTDRPLVSLVGVLGDKDWDRMLPPLFRRSDSVILAEPPSAPEGRRWDPEAVLASMAGGRGAAFAADVVRPFAAAVAEARRRAAGGTVVCTGSVHTVGDAMLALGIAPFQPEAARAGLQPGSPPA